MIVDKVIVPYVDDIIIPTQTEAEGLKKLSLVLNIAAMYGLEINWKKCQFLKKTVEYLGHIVTDSNVFSSTEKVQAVQKFPVPTNVKQLQGFLGLTNYFRKFISGYANIASSLYLLLRKDVLFEFGEAQLSSFYLLKKILSEEYRLFAGTLTNL